MAQKITPKRTYPRGFDVTAVIGHVEFNALGEMSAVEAAMSLIGKHHAEGQYRFPHEDGGEWVVNVEVEAPQADENVATPAWDQS